MWGKVPAFSGHLSVERMNISAFILKLFGWKAVMTVPDEPKCVICIAPHTSNWDFVVGKLGANAIGKKAGFLMKKEWFVFPLGPIFRAMGGIPVDRSRKTSVTDQVAAEFERHERFEIGITPEGTRKPNPEWKRGFYYIALKANVPIQLAYLDYGKKEIGIGKTFVPTGNVDADMGAIKNFYKNIRAKKPENFKM